MELEILQSRKITNKRRKEFYEKFALKKDNSKTRGEVFTPLNIIKEMIDTLPLHLFQNPNITFFDSCCGFGNFQFVLFKKLMKNLISIEDRKERAKHILEKMIYVSEICEYNLEVYKYIFQSHKYNLNVNCGDSLILKDMYFDVILGNPPYNTEFNKGGASPLYNKFIMKYIYSCEYLLFIVPSKWFSGGKGLQDFRNFMLSRRDIEYIKHFENSREIFKNVLINGGVNYFLKNSNYNGKIKINGEEISDDYDYLIQRKYDSILKKISKYDKITKIYMTNTYNIETNDKRLKREYEDNCIRCYVSKAKGFKLWINRDEIKKDYNFYKVLTPRANGGKKFGNIFIANKDEVHSRTYFCFKVENENQANNLIKYLRTSIVCFLLSLKKITQNISTRTLELIPLVNLDEEWNDEKLIKFFELNEEEVSILI